MIADENGRWIGERDCVYFAEAGGRVKIGWTAKDPQQRLRDLTIGSPFPLRLLAALEVEPGRGRTVEAAFHELFADEHVHGEWFKLSDRIRVFAYQIGKGWRSTAPADPVRRCDVCRELAPVAHGREVELAFGQVTFWACCRPCERIGPGWTIVPSAVPAGATNEPKSFNVKPQHDEQRHN